MTTAYWKDDLIRYCVRRGWKKVPANRAYLERYEIRVILTDMALIHSESPEVYEWVAPRDLDARFPGRYDMRYLPKALKQMRADKLLQRSSISRRNWSDGKLRMTWGYKVRGVG